MSPMVISNSVTIASNMSSIVSSVCRIAEAKKRSETEIYAIRRAEEVSCNRIKYEAKADKVAIDFCYTQAAAGLLSKKLSSSQKKELLIAMVDKMMSV